MIRAQCIETAGHWRGTPAGQVELDSAGRRRRRFVLRCANDLEFLLDLPSAPHMHHGDALVLEDGRLIEVIAAAEELAEVTAGNARALTEIAYHIGNRHLEAQILDGRLLIRRDHVIEDMVRGLGGSIAHILAPFEPAHGAYGGGHRHHD
ncbi:MAG: urease accessory protein UreE [Beijerinckiaceae bacterium]